MRSFIHCITSEEPHVQSLDKKRERERERAREAGSSDYERKKTQNLLVRRKRGTLHTSPMSTKTA
jgi:hypothetical protein